MGSRWECEGFTVRRDPALIGRDINATDQLNVSFLDRWQDPIIVEGSEAYTYRKLRNGNNSSTFYRWVRATSWYFWVLLAFVLIILSIIIAFGVRSCIEQRRSKDVEEKR